MAVAELLVQKKGVGVLVFNNRGHGYVSKVRKQVGKKVKTLMVGAAHEVFSESKHDIAGAVAFAKLRDAKRVVLVGHSTGSQKSVWYLAHKPDSLVYGAVLLAPLSDYAGMRKEISLVQYQKTVAVARALIHTKKPHALLPETLSPIPCDAQRWLSLYTLESQEEIFTYASGKIPRTLNTVKVPLLAVFSRKDQYADRPAEELASWFAAQETVCGVEIVDASDHGFSDAAGKVTKMIQTFTSTL